jgi:hypothetical protein
MPRSKILGWSQVLFILAKIFEFFTHSAGTEHTRKQFFDESSVKKSSVRVSFEYSLNVSCKPVLGIRIRNWIRIRRIHMFLGLQDLDPLVGGMDPDPSFLSKMRGADLNNACKKKL